MLTKEKSMDEERREGRGTKVISESRNYYYLGSDLFECKWCGERVTRQELLKHINQCEFAPDESKGKIRGRKYERKIKHEPEPDFLLDLPEKIYAMAQTLREELEVLPSPRSPRRIKYFLRLFSSSPEMWRNPLELAKNLSSYFKLNPVELHRIVDAVFRTKAEFEQPRKGYQGTFSCVGTEIDVAPWFIRKSRGLPPRNWNEFLWYVFDDLLRFD